MGRVYTSMQGKPIDMDRLSLKNELTPAIGNMKVNARGDELGPGGQILRTKEQILQDYYKNNPRAFKEEVVTRGNKK
jgi:hypothetical protein